MKTSVERILTTHVGSLVRTPAIIDLQIRRSLGEAVDGAQFDAAVRQGVSAVVQRQIQAGIDIVDDGEYGKLNWITYLGERLKGLDKTDLHTSVEDGARFWPEQERFGEFYRAYLRHETTDWLPDTPALKLVREARRPRDTQVEIWLDPARAHLPLRARLSQPDGGPPLELQLDSSASTGP